MSDVAVRQTRPQTLMWAGKENCNQEAQKSLRSKLWKNPHWFESGPAKSISRTSVRTIGFFCGRYKRLVVSSGCALYRGVLGRRRRDQPNHTMAASTHTAVDSQQHSIQTDDVRLTTMQCPVDGTQLSDRHRDGGRVECPACRGRFDVAEVIVDE